MKIKSRRTITSLCLMLLILAACGSKPSTSTQPTLTNSPSNSTMATPPATATTEPPVTPSVVTPITLNLEGDWPGGEDATRDEFNRAYPLFVKYLGEPLGKPTSLTWKLDPAITNNVDGWNAKEDMVSVGPLPDVMAPFQFPGFPPAWNLYRQFEHETAHLFLDVGEDTIHFTFGDWIWEAHAQVGQDLVYSERYGQNTGGALLYNIGANLGWDAVNGVPNERDKFQPGATWANSTAALRLMTEVLSYDTGLDYMSRVNAGLLAEYQATHDPNITPEQYKKILNAAANGRTIDGITPGDWLFSQPIANTNGALGPRIIVQPFYSLPSKTIELLPTGLTVTVFDRKSGSSPDQLHESPIPGLQLLMTVINTKGNVVRHDSAMTGSNGVADVSIFDQNVPLSDRRLAPGAYFMRAEGTYNGQTINGINFFVVTALKIGPVGYHLFIVPMNADGSALRPDLVDKLVVTNGEVQKTYDGILQVAADPGANVEFSYGDFHAVVSKPVTSRVVPLRIP